MYRAPLIAGCVVVASSSDVIVRLKATTDAPLAKLQAGEDTREGVNARLSQHASVTQAGIIGLLIQEQASYQGFWIDNVVAVKGASNTLIDKLEAHGDVVSVDPDEQVFLPSFEKEGQDSRTVSADGKPQGNIDALNTGAMWNAGYKGKGVVVANVDSGVRWTHEALKSNYRGFQQGAGGVVNHDYSFYDGTSPYPTDPTKLTPDNADVYGHGSHTMGTLAGGGPHSIGMAPEATWFTARPFNWDGASTLSGILAATEWTLCPTKYDGSGKDCSKGAQVVSMSFGGNSSLTWLNPTVKAMRAAGVLPVFAAGNVNAFQCGSVMEPGGSDDAIAVGGYNTGGGGVYYQSSGKGPGLDGKSIKPDFVAPARSINSVGSAADTGRDAYMKLTGTSMSTPHVSGAFALLLQAGLKPEDAVNALRSTAKQNLKKPVLTQTTCGGTPWNVYPNNIYGWGLPDVCAAAGVSCGNVSVVV